MDDADANQALKGALLESRIVTALQPFIGLEITRTLYGAMVASVTIALDELHAHPMNRDVAIDAVDEVLAIKRR
jgi:hypothetical protein